MVSRIFWHYEIECYLQSHYIRIITQFRENNSGFVAYKFVKLSNEFIGSFMNCSQFILLTTWFHEFRISTHYERVMFVDLFCLSSNLYHGQSKSGRYIRAFLSYGAFFSFEIRGSYLQIMNHLKDRYVQFVKSSYLLFFILCMVLGPYRRKSRNYSSHNHATLLFWFPSDRAVTTCTRARVLPDILLPWLGQSSNLNELKSNNKHAKLFDGIIHKAQKGNKRKYVPNYLSFLFDKVKVFIE